MNWLENVTLNGQPVNSSLYYKDVTLDTVPTISGTLKFTPKEDGIIMYDNQYSHESLEISPQVKIDFSGAELTKGTEYTLTYNNVKKLDLVFKKNSLLYFNNPADMFIYEVF